MSASFQNLLLFCVLFTTYCLKKCQQVFPPVCPECRGTELAHALFGTSRQWKGVFICRLPPQVHAGRSFPLTRPLGAITADQPACLQAAWAAIWNDIYHCITYGNAKQAPQFNNPPPPPPPPTSCLFSGCADDGKKTLPLLSGTSRSSVASRERQQSGK